MGIIVNSEQLSDQKQAFSGLPVYVKRPENMEEAGSVSRELAAGLMACGPNRRSRKLEQIFNGVLDHYPDGVMIKDIDVMFHPDYQVDVLKILIAAGKRKRYGVIWPGRYEDGALLYAEEGYPDYRVYRIGEYDIVCVK